MEWDKFLKRYVWDDERTPYFVPVARLTQRQAGYELRAYAIFLGFLFAIVAAGSFSPKSPHGGSVAVSLFSFSMVAGALLLALTRHAAAATFCASAPVAAALYVYAFGFHPNLALVDHAVIGIFILLWLRYAMRVVAIGRRYDAMPPGEPPAPDDPANLWRRRR